MVSSHRQNFEQAIKFAEEMPLDSFMKSSLYRYLIAVPKAGAQVAKTVLSPFYTHA